MVNKSGVKMKGVINLKSRIKDGMLFATFLGVDILTREFDVASYSSQYENIIHGYAHDVLLPAGLYFCYSALNLFNGNKVGNAAFVFFGCSAAELAQMVGVYPGTFDPQDFLAYAAGTGLAWGIDVLASKEKKQKSLEQTLEGKQ